MNIDVVLPTNSLQVVSREAWGFRDEQGAHAQPRGHGCQKSPGAGRTRTRTWDGEFAEGLFEGSWSRGTVRVSPSHQRVCSALCSWS